MLFRPVLLNRSSTVRIKIRFHGALNDLISIAAPDLTEVRAQSNAEIGKRTVDDLAIRLHNTKFVIYCQDLLVQFKIV